MNNSITETETESKHENELLKQIHGDNLTESLTDEYKENDKRSINTTYERVNKDQILVRKEYRYHKDNGKDIYIQRAYYKQANKHSRKLQSHYNDIVEYTSDINNVRGKTYKQIMNDFNKKYHTKYTISTFWYYVSKCNPYKKQEREKVKESIIAFLKNEANTENRSLKQIVKAYNREHNTDYSYTLIGNYYRIIKREALSKNAEEDIDKLSE